MTLQRSPQPGSPPPPATQGQLRESEERFRAAFDYAAIGMALVDLNGRWLRVNPALSRMLAYEPDELLALTFQDLTHPDDLEADLHHVQRLLRGEQVSYQMEKRYVRADGQIITALLSVSLVHDDEGRPKYFVSQIQDITDRKRMEAELRESHDRLARLASIDGLTGITNRRQFDAVVRDAFEQAVRYKTAVSMLLLDVDHFKAYNDSFGHLSGDDVLVSLARLLHRLARSTDTVARFGGEEFVVLLPHTDIEGATQFAERCRAAVAAETWPHRRVTVSIGVSGIHPTDRSPAEAIARADAALYSAKRAGRNRVCVAPTPPPPLAYAV